MKREKDVKREVRKVLALLGDEAAISMYVPSGYGKQGIEDFTVCVRGRFLAIETKFGSNRLTAMQERRREEVEHAGGTYVVVTEKNVHRLGEWIARRF